MADVTHNPYLTFRDEWTPAPAWFEWSVIVAGLATLVVEVVVGFVVVGWMV